MTQWYRCEPPTGDAPVRSGEEVSASVRSGEDDPGRMPGASAEPYGLAPLASAGSRSPAPRRFGETA